MERFSGPLLGLLTDFQEAFLDQVEVLLDVALEGLLLEPAENLRRFKYLKLVCAGGALVFVQEFDHVGVVVKLYQAEHVAGAELWHVDLADVGRRVREKLSKHAYGLFD